MERKLHRGNLTKLLKHGFTINELKDFCFEIESFNKFYDERHPNEGFVRELIAYAERKEFGDSLLDWAKKENPAKYDNYQPYYREPPRADVVESYRSTHDRLVQFFNLKEANPNIAIFVSRHSTTTQLPIFSVSQEEISSSKALKRISDYQAVEARQIAEAQPTGLREFAVVSAIELIEASRLTGEIDRSNLLDLFSNTQQEQLPYSIRVRLDICPRADRFKRILEIESAIFIGGPRSNLGTYYYLFGEKAGEMRPKRIPASTIESIGNPDNQITCGPERNLGVIQKYFIKESNRTIFYLAGTGVNGTAAASAYLRLHWLDLYEEFGNDNFCRVIEVAKRSDEDVVGYISSEWTDNDWAVRKK